MSSSNQNMSSNEIVTQKNEQMFNTAEQLTKILTELSEHYEKSVRSIEGVTGFNMNCIRPLGRNHLLQKPSCMFLGPYSSGKSTALAYLLQTKDPSIRIGPEPTTDTFHFLLHGSKVSSGEGTYLMNDPSFGLDNFFEDDGFARHCRWTTMPNPVLSSLLVIDSPGFLGGENMAEKRGIDMSRGVERLAANVTRIYLFVDVNKVDISPEFKSVIRILRPFMSKVRIIINKADSISAPHLMRVVAAFFFNFGKIYEAPEMPRVYVGSFWDQPYTHQVFRDLFDSEKSELLTDLQKLPSSHYPNVVGSMTNRMSLFLRYLIVVRELRKTMTFFKKQKRMDEIMATFDDFYRSTLRSEGLMMGDPLFVKTIKDALAQINPTNIPEGCTKKNVDQLKFLIDQTLPDIMGRLNRMLHNQEEHNIEGGVFSVLKTSNKLIEAEEAQRFTLSSADIEKADNIFATFDTQNGRVDAGQLKPVMLQSKLPYESLAKIWELSTDTSDGRMDMYEWRIASFLLSYFSDGKSIPSSLPPSFSPSAMRPT